MDIKKLGYDALSKVYNKVSGQEAPPYKGGWADGGQKKEPPKKREPVDRMDVLATAKGFLHDRSGKILIGTVAAAVVLAAIGAGIKTYLESRPVEVNLAEAVVFGEPEGLNGYGAISYGLDKNVLKTLMFGEQQGAADSTDTAVDAEVLDMQRDKAVDLVTAAVTLSADKVENLSNGDVVRVMAEIAPNTSFPGFIFMNGVAPCTIKGLPDGKVIDPFNDDMIGVKIEGMDGIATAELDIKGKEIYTYYLNYDLAPKDGLSNGDTVQVTISPDEEKIKELGYAIPDVRTREYEVSGLARPVSTQGEISDLILDEMTTAAQRMIREEYNAVQIDDDDQIVQSPQVVSMYFLDKSDKRESYTDRFSGLQMVNGIVITGYYAIDQYEAPKREGEETTITRWGGYYAFFFPDIVIEPDGSCVYRTDGITEKAFSFGTEEEFYSWLTGEFHGFNIEKVGRTQ